MKKIIYTLALNPLIVLTHNYSIRKQHRYAYYVSFSLILPASKSAKNRPFLYSQILYYAFSLSVQRDTVISYWLCMHGGKIYWGGESVPLRASDAWLMNGVVQLTFPLRHSHKWRPRTGFLGAQRTLSRTLLAFAALGMFALRLQQYLFAYETSFPFKLDAS